MVQTIKIRILVSRKLAEQWVRIGG